MNLGELGNWSSILGLIVSLIVLLYAVLIEKRVKRLKNKIQTNELLPAIIENLKQRNFQLLKKIDEYDCFTDEIPVTLEKIRAQLNSAKEKSPKNIKNEIHKVQVALDKLLKKKLIPTGKRKEGTNIRKLWQQTEANKEDVRRIYFKLHFTIETLELYINEWKTTEIYD